MISVTYPVTLWYDGSCRLCSGEIRNLAIRDTRARLRFVDCSAEDFQGGPAPREQLMNAIHAVDARGRVFIGVDSFEVAYRAVGLEFIARLLTARWLRPWAVRAYPWVVRNRHRLPGWLIGPLFDRLARRAARRAAARASACRDDACAAPGEGSTR